MFDAFWHWIFAPTTGVETLRETARMLGETRRNVAMSEAVASILRERVERGDHDAACKLPRALLDVERSREELRRLDNRFAGLESKAHAAGVRMRIDIPSFHPDELRAEAERQLTMAAAEAHTNIIAARTRPDTVNDEPQSGDAEENRDRPTLPDGAGNNPDALERVGGRD